MPENAEYRVQLDIFSGPLDLLLYLIRRDEIDIQDIPLARLTEQYLDYLAVLEALDPNAIGDFLVMASTLIELKSRALLPSAPLDAAEEDDDPRNVLVKQLLEYKRFKDAAARLGSAADDRARRFVRKPAQLPPDLQGVELEEVEIWDLVEAFGRVMNSIGAGPRSHEVTIDDKPIAFYAQRILDAIDTDGPLNFSRLFDHSHTRAEIIGLFLAVLELVRKQRVRAEQDTARSEIYLFLLIEADDGEPRPIRFASEPAEAAESSESAHPTDSAPSEAPDADTE